MIAAIIRRENRQTFTASIRTPARLRFRLASQERVSTGRKGGPITITFRGRSRPERRPINPKPAARDGVGHAPWPPPHVPGVLQTYLHTRSSRRLRPARHESSSHGSRVPQPEREFLAMGSLPRALTYDSARIA